MKYKFNFNHDDQSMSGALGVPRANEWLDLAKTYLDKSKSESNTEIFESYLQEVDPQNDQELMAASLVFGFTGGSAKVLRHVQSGVIPSSLILECLSEKLKDSDQDMGYGMSVDAEAVVDKLGDDKDDF